MSAWSATSRAQGWPTEGDKVATARASGSVRGQATERLPRSAERGILPAPAGASVRGLCSSFERLSVGNGQALTPPVPRRRQALSPGTPGVKGRGLRRAQCRTGRSETARLCTSQGVRARTKPAEGRSCERARGRAEGLFLILD